MERVAFLVEETGMRLGCMLNPESVVLRRRAGVRIRRSVGGLLTGNGLTDDPVLFTGGGTTELDLDLLFDVSLTGSTVRAEDVRGLTGPLWDLAENGSQPRGYGAPPQVRFVWGKEWNIPGVVIAVAERLEYFTPAGTPRRSWLRLRMRRVSEPSGTRHGPEEQSPSTTWATAPLAKESAGAVLVHEITGGGAPSATGPVEPVSDERLDQLAERYYGDARLWRLIAAFNDLDDPMRIASGELLQIPALTGSGGLA